MKASLGATLAAGSIVVMAALMAGAQAPEITPVPSSPGGSSYVVAPQPFGYGWGSPGTAASAGMMGFADVVRSAGQANLMNSQAVQNLTQARSMDIDNRVKWTDSYYHMREANRAYREAKIGPRLSDEQIIRIAQQGVPDRLNSAQLDPLSGGLAWPLILQEDEYAPQREKLDELFASRATASGITPNLYNQILDQTGQLLSLLQQNVNRYSGNQWTAARRFVESLAYEARHPAG